MKSKHRIRFWVRAKRVVILLGAIAVGLLDLMWVTSVARDAQGAQVFSTQVSEGEYDLPSGPMDRFL